MAPVRELPERPARARRPEVGAPPVEPAEATRDTHPPGASWRADALAASPHRRLADDIPAPLADFDTERAAALCAAVTRDLLRDFAPALALLAPDERRRVQALAAFARTLFDFACQRGVEGERLAQINRWDWELEAALAGQPAGQPVFVAVAAADRQRPWPRPALTALGALARRLARREEPRIAGAEADALAAALAEALFDRPATPAVRALGAAAFVAAGLVETPPADAGTHLDRLRTLTAGLTPPAYRAFVGFIRRATGELLRQRSRGQTRPRLGLGARLRCLVLARFQ